MPVSSLSCYAVSGGYAPMLFTQQCSAISPLLPDQPGAANQGRKPDEPPQPGRDRIGCRYRHVKACRTMPSRSIEVNDQVPRSTYGQMDGAHQRSRLLCVGSKICAYYHPIGTQAWYSNDATGEMRTGTTYDAHIKRLLHFGWILKEVQHYYIRTGGERFTTSRLPSGQSYPWRCREREQSAEYGYTY